MRVRRSGVRQAVGCESIFFGPGSKYSTVEVRCLWCLCGCPTTVSSTFVLVSFERKAGRARPHEVWHCRSALVLGLVIGRYKGTCTARSLSKWSTQGRRTDWPRSLAQVGRFQGETGTEASGLPSCLGIRARARLPFARVLLFAQPLTWHVFWNIRASKHRAPASRSRCCAATAAVRNHPLRLTLPPPRGLFVDLQF